MRGKAGWAAWAMSLIMVAGGRPVNAGELPGRLQGPLFLPRCVPDPLRETCYVVNATGGIDAVDLRTGELIWKTDYPALPLRVFENKLAVLTLLPGGPVKVPNGTGQWMNNLRLLLLDTANKGAPLLVSDPMPVPHWVHLSAMQRQGPGWTFTAEVSLGDGALALRWETQEDRAPGTCPGGGVIVQPMAASGNARIDFKSGRVELLAEDQQAAGGELTAPPGFADVKSAPYDLRWCRFVWENKPVTVGTTLVALEKRRDGDQETLTLKTWDHQTKQPRPPVELISGRNLHATIVPEAGLLYVISAGNCTAFSLHGGGHSAPFAVPKGTEAVGLNGSRVYLIVETSSTSSVTSGRSRRRSSRVVRATDRYSGAILWERAIEGRLEGILDS